MRLLIQMAPLPGRCTMLSYLRRQAAFCNPQLVKVVQSSTAQVEAAERYERAWARRAAASLCVSAAMQSELRRNWCGLALLQIGLEHGVSEMLVGVGVCL